MSREWNAIYCPLFHFEGFKAAISGENIKRVIILVDLKDLLISDNPL